MKSLNILNDLISRFEQNKVSYTSTSYNETQLRREFIDPFFKALGWDIDNEQGFAEAYKDVIHEDSIKVGGATKAPDYCFRIGGVRKFFVETKKPFVNLKDDIHPAFQVRRYAWSANLPLSILTDFQEFAVYDCRVKPNKTDKASVGRILYFTYKDYEEKWEEISNIFSKEAILKGSFDKYADSTKNKKGTTEVDSAFLEEIERWREILAKNIALRNPNLSQRELNFAVQRTIDRIIFLRICEDRGIEHYGTLMALLNGGKVYDRMRQNFKKADDIYNSGLFHFRDEKGRAEPPDTLTLSLEIDDNPIKDIIRNLYYPESPYEFSVLPPDILGQVYERFLGSVIRLTKGHQAKVEVKPEIKKAGGVFYTPTYIVDYIVKNTVGKLIKGKSPKQIEKLSILDPACGSGTFLIQAYQTLLDYHYNWYLNDGPDKHSKGKTPQLAKSYSGEWRLSTQERKRILLNNIYGVDIDSRAVEVTKLSLLFKVLQGENEQSLNAQLSLFHERALPDLENNIKCGNSLIGHDFYKKPQGELFSGDTDFQINAFSWADEFKEIIVNGGFDAIIGNPPYIRIQTLNDTNPESVEYFNHRYENIISGNYDIYILFCFKGISLLKDSGYFSYIMPHKFFTAQMGEKLRKFISSLKIMRHVVDFSTNQVFENATTYTCLFFIEKKKHQKFTYKKYSLGENIRNLDEMTVDVLENDSFDEKPWIFIPQTYSRIIRKIKNQKYNFKDITLKIFKGSSTGNDTIYLLSKIDEKGKTSTCFSKQLDKNIKIETDVLFPFLSGENIRKFKIAKANQFLIFPYDHKSDYKLLSPEQLNKYYPKAFEYLSVVKSDLQKRKIVTNDSDFYKYSAARSLKEYLNPKILIPDMLVSNRIAYDAEGQYFHGPAIHSVKFDRSRVNKNDLYFLSILNSNLFWYFIRCTSTALRGDAYRLTPEYLNTFAFPDCCDVDLEKMVSLSKMIMDIENKIEEAKIHSDITLLERNRNNAIKNLNEIVYRIYELEKSEIELIENGRKN